MLGNKLIRNGEFIFVSFQVSWNAKKLLQTVYESITPTYFNKSASVLLRNQSSGLTSEYKKVLCYRLDYSGKWRAQAISIGVRSGIDMGQTWFVKIFFANEIQDMSGKEIIIIKFSAGF